MADNQPPGPCSACAGRTDGSAREGGHPPDWQAWGSRAARCCSSLKRRCWERCTSAVSSVRATAPDLRMHTLGIGRCARSSRLQQGQQAAAPVPGQPRPVGSMCRAQDGCTRCEAAAFSAGLMLTTLLQLIDSAQHGQQAACQRHDHAHLGAGSRQQCSWGRCRAWRAEPLKQAGCRPSGTCAAGHSAQACQQQPAACPSASGASTLGEAFSSSAGSRAARPPAAPTASRAPGASPEASSRWARCWRRLAS